MRKVFLVSFSCLVFLLLLLLTPWGVQYGPATRSFQKQVAEGILDPSSAWSRPVHPTPLYECGALLIVLAAILLLSRRDVQSKLSSVFHLRSWSLREGKLFLGFALYGCFCRFLSEFVRNDGSGTYVGPPTLEQVTATVMLALVLGLLIRRRGVVKPRQLLSERWRLRVNALHNSMEWKNETLRRGAP
ncbi:MAG: prolipoprotein diacylglyceryl transferase [Acidobacteria bacterium]|nr:prolipoprotein diacylglyceryl transferase [Acidobacteriota bacterium]